MTIPACYPQDMPHAVLFDWDNTLVNTCAISFNIFNDVLRHFGKPLLGWETYMINRGLSCQSFLQQHFSPQEAPEAAGTIEKILAQSKVDTTCLFPRTQELLAWLKQKSIPMGAVSNKEGKVLREEVAHVGLSTYFQAVVGSGDTAEDKPSPMPLLYALKSMSLKPGHHIWFVGDSLVDVACAYRAGCVPVAIRCPQAAPCPVITTLDCHDLQQILQKLDHGYNVLKT